MNFYLLGRVRGRGGGFFDFLPLDMVGQELGCTLVVEIEVVKSFVSESAFLS